MEVGTPVVDTNDAPGSPLTAVLLHPHPDMGGNRFNHVVDTLYRSLPAHGFTAARFDFSSSDIAVATAEVAAVVDACGPGRAALIGYSFGAGVALRVTSPHVAGWFVVAPYLEPGADVGAASDPRPKRVLVAEQDQWCPPARVRPAVAGWANTSVTTLPGADHFLMGATAPVADAAAEWLTELSGQRA
jgi:alpha/beta superfamily hydrolase